MIGKKEESKWVVVDTYGPIKELGGISGPIVTPCKIPIRTIVDMVNNRKVVYEVNPMNMTEKVKLRQSNVDKKNFDGTKKPEKVVTKKNYAPSVPKVETVMKEQKTVVTETTTHDKDKDKKKPNNKMDFIKK